MYHACVHYTTVLCLRLGKPNTMWWLYSLETSSCLQAWSIFTVVSLYSWAYLSRTVLLSIDLLIKLSNLMIQHLGNSRSCEPTVSLNDPLDITRDHNNFGTSTNGAVTMHAILRDYNYSKTGKIENKKLPKTTFLRHFP